MRSFIAIDIPELLRAALRDVISRMASDSGGIRWVQPANVHLTLKFLGEVPDDIVRKIGRRLALIGKIHRPFTVDVRGAGAFPSLRDPNVLWVGLGSSGQLAALYEDIEGSLAEIGFQRERRRFSPHLTVGRVKGMRGIDPVMKVLATYKETFFGTIEVREILLMKSTLKPSGAEYSKIVACKLGEDNP
ncbi:MAG TPA: RNA 2',3'-cyclic phosphodiesterase [Dissulfurispiraceae bacterium]|nr:RNA 2',3'-cyclic phosphodiesterase [Dissulfurispiraceae bacterium]